MVVYIVLECWDYEGQNIRGVFSTLEEAEKIAGQFGGSEDCNPGTRIEMWLVDGKQHMLAHVVK